MASQFEFFDGFGSGNLDLWDVVNGGASLTTGISGMDTYCLVSTTNFQYVAKNLTPRDYYYFAFLYRPYGGSDEICQFYNNSTLLGTVRHEIGGFYLPKLYWGTTLIATGSLSLTQNTTRLIEVYYLPHLTTGNFQIKVNGIADPSLTLSGIKTAPSTLQINKMVIGNTNIGGTGHFGRVIIGVDSWIGDLRIQTLTPSAAGNYSEWTPSSGSNYQTVDEIPYNDTDYNLTNEVDKKDSFICTDLSGTIASVKSVIVQSATKSTGTPTPTTIRQLIRTNNSDYVGDAKTVATSNKTVYNKWDQNPDTSSNWTTSDINNAEYGYQSST